CAHVLRYVHYVRTWRQRIRVRDPCTETVEPSPSAPGDLFQYLQKTAREQLYVVVVGHPPAVRAVDRGLRALGSLAPPQLDQGVLADHVGRLPLEQGGDVAAGGEDLVELGGDGPGERRPVPQGDDHRVRPGVLRAHLAVRDAGQHFYRGAELLGERGERGGLH